MSFYKVNYSLTYLDSNKKPCVIEDSIEGLTEKQVELLKKIQEHKFLSVGSNFIELEDFDIYGRKLCYSSEVERLKDENRLLKEYYEKVIETKVNLQVENFKLKYFSGYKEQVRDQNNNLRKENDELKQENQELKAILSFKNDVADSMNQYKMKYEDALFEIDDKDEIIKDCLDLFHNVRWSMTTSEYERLVEICKRVKGVK